MRLVLSWKEESGHVILYFERDYTDEIQVVADVVVGADGVRSKARTLVLGYEDKPKSSGYAIWRAWYSVFLVKILNLTRVGFQVRT
jgi:2-polyprenyl-6-methoxyphenol hydroxylase-like FAD-dependent oxidoreductase